MLWYDEFSICNFCELKGMCQCARPRRISKKKPLFFFTFSGVWHFGTFAKMGSLGVGWIGTF